MRAVGIDSHKDTLAVAVVDEVGRQVATTEVANTPEGFERLAGWLTRHRPERVGIEGSGGHGRQVALRLLRAGYEVVDVPPQLTARERRRQRTPAKSDITDAVGIARVTLREAHLPGVRTNGDLEDLRVLVRYRRELVAERTRLASRLHADLEQLHPGYQQRIGRLTTRRNLDRARRLLTGDPQPRAVVARQRVTQLRQLTRQITDLTSEITQRARRLNTSLVTIPGIGDLTAAELLAEIGDISRYRTRAQFAMANGTAPIPASSGRTQRYRLNRGGNRRLNRIIHLIALTQISHHPQARVYYQRKQAEGKTRREAIRSLKRHISDRIYRTLRDTHPHTALT
ncbi:MAG TPA: IS110 family transposase [Actinobacteria bacterium]|nr:IS110 family transposase [Actinomycetota bacterium]